MFVNDIDIYHGGGRRAAKNNYLADDRNAGEVRSWGEVLIIIAGKNSIIWQCLKREQRTRGFLLQNPLLL